MTVLAVIPARMGSMRIPRKNLCEIEAGVSLIQHAATCARDSGVVDNIILSTDEEIYLNCAKTVIRPSELCGPTSDIAYAVMHATLSCPTRHDYVMTLQPAVLARSPLIIRRLVKFMEANSCRGALTMAATHRWLWELGTDAKNDWSPNQYPRSQDCRPRSVEINAVQIATWEDATAENPKRWGIPLAVAVLPPWCAALDIDTPEDLAMARDLWPWAKTRLETCAPDLRIIRTVNGGEIA